jgi:LDH2 family malate/lactate/ureidoglycolate dehydrogenase
VLAADPAAFGERAAFDARMDALATAVLGAGDGTRLPGSRSVAAEAAADHAVEIGDGLVATLRRLAGELGVAALS